MEHLINGILLYNNTVKIRIDTITDYIKTFIFNIICGTTTLILP